MVASLQILHVDDDPEIRIIVDLSLRIDPACSVVSATSAPEALALLQAGTARPDALLLDYYISGTNGVDLLAAIRQDRRWAAMPGVFLTARTMAADVEAMVASGAAGILTKPFNPVTLAEELRALLGR